MEGEKGTSVTGNKTAEKGSPNGGNLQVKKKGERYIGSWGTGDQKPRKKISKN